MDKLTDYPIRSFDKLRYSDTDRQGHVNNAVFSTFLETGRVELFYQDNHPIASMNASFVIAKIELEFIAEIKWPGTVEIGTAVSRVGNSSMTLIQAIFQHDVLVARAQSVIVQVDDAAAKSKPLSEAARQVLATYLLPTT